MSLSKMGLLNQRPTTRDTNYQKMPSIFFKLLCGRDPLCGPVVSLALFNFIAVRPTEAMVHILPSRIGRIL